VLRRHRSTFQNRQTYESENDHMKIKILLLAAGLAAVVLSACGGPGSAAMSVSMREFSFTPDTFTVPSGAEVTLTLRNLGALEHNFHIMNLGEEIEGSWTEADEAGALDSLANVSGGDVSTVTITAPNKAGEYQVLCSVPSHFELGMFGTLTVTEP
jgi:uncharacterized cupredoxin-like copper-binding protein